MNNNMCAEYVHCGNVLYMILGLFIKLCIKFFSLITDKICLVELGWLKHPLSPKHAHKLMSQHSLVQAKTKARPTFDNNQHGVS